MSSRIVSIITQIMVMAVVLSVVLLFIGIGILLMIHLCIVGRAFGRTVNGDGGGRRRRPQEEEEEEEAAVTGENHRIGFGPASTTTHIHGGGMSAEEVQKLPLFEYKNGDMYAVLDHHSTRNEKGTVGSCGDGDGGGSAGFDCCWCCECECAVCLDGFQFGQKCRLLPVCGHIFHSTCVDAWLLKNPVCPICRTRAEQPQDNSFCSGSSQLISRFLGDSASASASASAHLLESVAVNVCDVNFPSLRNQTVNARCAGELS